MQRSGDGSRFWPPTRASCPPAQRRAVLLAIVVLHGALALGCRDATRSRLAGRWVGRGMEVLGGFPSAASVGWARGTAFEFSGTQLTVAVPGEAPRRGRFRVLSDDDGELELSVVGHHGHEDRTRLTLETDDLLRWHVDDVNVVVMQRP